MLQQQEILQQQKRLTTATVVIVSIYMLTYFCVTNEKLNKCVNTNNSNKNKTASVGMHFITASDCAALPERARAAITPAIHTYMHTYKQSSKYIVQNKKSSQWRQSKRRRKRQVFARNTIMKTAHTLYVGGRKQRATTPKLKIK